MARPICTVHVEMNRNQLDNILPALKSRLVLFEDGLGLDELLTSAAAPCLPLGSIEDRSGDTFLRRGQPTRAGRCRGPGALA